MKFKCRFLAICCVLFLSIGLCGLLPVVAEEQGNWSAIEQGKAVSGAGIYAEELAVGRIDITVSLQNFAEGEAVLVGLLRSEGVLPDLENKERGLVFGIMQQQAGYALTVYSVTAAKSTVLLDGYSLEEGPISFSIVRNSENKYKLYVNGSRLVADYRDLLADTRANDFALVNKTHLAFVSESSGSLIFEEIVSSADGESSSSYEWMKKDSVVASAQNGAGEFTDEAACFSVWQNVMYTQVVLNADFKENSSVSLGFSASASTVLTTEGGGKGFLLNFYEKNGGIYLDVYGINLETSRAECLRYYVGSAGIAQLRVELKKKMPATGFGLLVNGTRVQSGVADVFEGYVKEDVGRYIDGTTTGTYLSVSVSGTSAEVEEILSMQYDPEPIANDKLGLANDSAYGTASSEWSGDVNVDAQGIMTSAGGASLKESLELEYVAFWLGFEYLSDAAQVLDSYVAFGLSSQPDAQSVLPDSDNEANSIFFLLSVRNGLLYISGYARYEKDLTNILGWTALTNVSAESDLFIEFVYYDYDLTMYINGESLKTSYGSNPLNDYYSLYFENDEYKTNLCFANYCYADENKPTLTAENCAKYRVYGIMNDLPDRYKDEGMALTENEEVIPGEMNVWLGIVLPIACMLVFVVAADAVVFLILRKRKLAGAAAKENTAQCHENKNGDE